MGAEISGYGDKILISPTKIVDTMACAIKMAEIIKSNPKFTILKDTKYIKANLDGDAIKVILDIKGQI